MVLNTGDVHVFGEHLLDHHQHKYTRIATFHDKPTTLYLDTSHTLAALQTLHSESESLHLSTPIVYPSRLPWNELLYSQAALENVEQVILCRDESVITGLVFCYSNGSRASLGWLVHDRLSAPKSADPNGLWLLITTNKQQLPQVINVSFTRPTTGENTYFHIRWSGVLVWWFSLRQCQLHFDGRQTQALRVN